MINVSNDFKTRTKKIKQQNIKLGILNGELTVKEVHFMTVKEFNTLPIWMLRKRQEVIAKELKYSFEGSLFKTIMKQIEITVKNAVELKDKNVNFQYGIYVNNNFEYIDLGDFYIKDIDDDKGKSELVVTGYDKMIHFMKTFKQSELQLTYPCTMLTLIQKMCEVCGVELYSTNFFHADLEVDEDYFTAQELTYRDVLEKVAQSTLTTIFIKDNKLYLHKLADSVVQKLDASYLTGLTVKEKFGPVNALVLGRGDVEDNVEAKDDTSIAQNGRCEIRFDENEFVEYQREQVIDEMFEQIKGLEYYAFEGSDVGVMWLEPCDLIEVEDNEESTYETIYLNANITINTGISSDVEASIPEETNTEYKVTTKEEKKNLKVERLAKKNEGLIQDLVQETDENTEKISEHTQTIDEIKDTLKSVTTTVSKTVKEVQVMYALSNSATEAPTSGWSVEAPEWQEGKYMWQKTVTVFTDDTQEESQATCIQGAKGQDGVNGTNGRDGLGIEVIETQYYLSNSETELTGGTWKETQDKWSKGKYIWTRSKITWSDESVTYSSPVVAEGLNSANENADSANEGTKEVTTKMSEVEKTVEGITQTVNQTTERLNNDYSTTEQMNSAIEQKAGSITSSVTESIENIQVGGTNLIENSAPYNLDKWGISNSNSIELTLQDEETAVYGKCLRIRTLNQPTTACGIYIIPTTKVLETGKEYCFSIWLKATAATNVIVGYARGGQTTFNVTTEWKKFEYKFTALAPTGASHGFAINVPAGTTAGRSVYVHSIKLEEGNKITAWSPAPEDDVKGSEIGTKIEQNAKSVQVAWNQLSQSIKFEGDNNDATIAFYDGDKKFGEMGANTVDDNRYISFATLLDYGQSISDGMAWGIQTTSDNKFYPILFIKDFFMANKNAGNFSGQLVLNFCDLVLGTGAIKAANVRIGVDDTANGIYFEDTETGDILMRVYPDSNIGLARIDILNAISFYKNQGGSNSFKIGTSDKYVLITDEGDFHVMNGDLLLGTSDYPVSFSLYLRSLANIWGNVSIDGNIYADNISSDRRIKKNIEDSDTNALNIINKIKHRQFEMKKNGKHYSIGYIAQELEDVDKNFVLIREKDEKTEEQYYVNELPILATATKAIQELSEKVEQLQSKIDELEQKINEKEK